MDMMRNARHLLLIAAALLALAACETSFEVELPDHEPVLVVNGLFRADSLWLVDLSHSVPPGGDLSIEDQIRNATVVIRSEGAVVDTLRKRYNNPGTEYQQFVGEYGSSSHRPQPGRTYTLKASAPGYEPVTATSYVPEPVPFTVRARPTGDEPEEYDITVRFTDPAGEANRYLLLREVHLIGHRVHIRTLSFESRDPIFFGDDYDCFVGEPEAPRYGRFAAPAIFNDAGIDGETYEIDLTARLHTPPDDEELTVEHHLLLVALSEPYFRFKESLRCNFGGENPFVEPVQPHGNVEGGFGIFAGSSAARRRIETAGGE